MSVLTEKNAVKAAFTTILGNAISFTAPDTSAAHVFMYVLPEPNPAGWPALVLSRTHWALTEIAAGGGAEMGNDDNDPNWYAWEYYDQLISQTGSTVEATMDSHDAFLEQLAVYVSNHLNKYLPDGGGVRQAIGFGEWVNSDANKDGPFALVAGSAVILSTGQISCKSLNRPPT